MLAHLKIYNIGKPPFAHLPCYLYRPKKVIDGNVLLLPLFQSGQPLLLHLLVVVGGGLNMLSQDKGGLIRHLDYESVSTKMPVSVIYAIYEGTQVLHF